MVALTFLAVTQLVCCRVSYHPPSKNLLKHITNTPYSHMNTSLYLTHPTPYTVHPTPLQFIDEAERSLHDAIMIVRRALKHAHVVAGGGAIDMEVCGGFGCFVRLVSCACFMCHLAVKNDIATPWMSLCPQPRPSCTAFLLCCSCLVRCVSTRAPSLASHSCSSTHSQRRSRWGGEPEGGLLS